MLLEKQEKKTANKVVMKDVNRDLMIALLAIPVYGKEARDEEILSIIINANNAGENDILTRIRDRYNKMLSGKKIKKTKSGVRDTDGYMVLVPRV